MLEQIREAYKKQLHRLYSSDEIDELFSLSAEEVLGLRKSQLLLKKSIALNEDQLKRFHEILAELGTGRPIQYILGYTWFYGNRILVNEQVLIPRSETEELVKLLLQENTFSTPHILDIGTGSGCIAISIKKRMPAAELSAWDVSEGALAVARRNARENQTDITFGQVDILTGIKPDASFDIIVSNPPYITSVEKKDMHANVLLYEPSVALFVPDEKPLLFYEAVAKFAHKHLTQGGQLFFEINEQYALEIKELLEGQGFSRVSIHQDMQGKDRMIAAVH